VSLSIKCSRARDDNLLGNLLGSEREMKKAKKTNTHKRGESLHLTLAPSLLSIPAPKITNKEYQVERQEKKKNKFKWRWIKKQAISLARARANSHTKGIKLCFLKYVSHLLPITRIGGGFLVAH